MPFDVSHYTLARKMAVFEVMRWTGRHERGHKHLNCRQWVGLPKDFWLLLVLCQWSRPRAGCRGHRHVLFDRPISLQYSKHAPFWNLQVMPLVRLCFVLCCFERELRSLSSLLTTFLTVTFLGFYKVLLFCGRCCVIQENSMNLCI